jgi:hypothetical protein
VFRSIKINLFKKRIQEWIDVFRCDDRIEITVDAFMIAKRNVNVASGFNQNKISTVISTL